MVLWGLDYVKDSCQRSGFARKRDRTSVNQTNTLISQNLKQYWMKSQNAQSIIERLVSVQTTANFDEHEKKKRDMAIEMGNYLEHDEVLKSIKLWIFPNHLRISSHSAYYLHYLHTGISLPASQFWSPAMGIFGAAARPRASHLQRIGATVSGAIQVWSSVRWTLWKQNFDKTRNGWQFLANFGTRFAFAQEPSLDELSATGEISTCHPPSHFRPKSSKSVC